MLYGFKVESGGVARPGADIELNGKKVSTVASGTFSPTLSVAIGMAYLPTGTPDQGQKFVIRQGVREFQAVTVKLPFYRSK
jgi:aminomethyltransferase